MPQIPQPLPRTYAVPCYSNPLPQDERGILQDIAQSLRRLVCMGGITPPAGASLLWFALAGAAPDNGDGSDGDTWGDMDTGKLWEKVAGVWTQRLQGAVSVNDAAANFVTPTQGTLGATLA